MNRDILFVGLAGNNLAFSQKVLCCHPCLSYNSECSCQQSTWLPTYQLTMININFYTENINYKDTVACIQKNNLPAKEIIFNKNNNSFVVLYDEGNSYKSNSELYLFNEISSSTENTALQTTEFGNEFKLECPLQKIHSIYYSDEDLYVLGQQDNKLILMLTRITVAKEKHECYWKKITTLSYKDFNDRAKFSSNGKFIFLLQQNKQLLIYAKEDSWAEINKISSSSFPIDINYNSGSMIFINDKTLVINTLKSNDTKEINLNNVTAACFITNTEKCIVFTSEPKIYLLEKSTNKTNSYHIASSQRIKYLVKKVYAHPKYYDKLIVLASSVFHANHCFNMIYWMSVPIPVGAFLACCGTCCCCWQECCTGNPCAKLYMCGDYCCGATTCSKYKANSLIGTYVGAGCSATLWVTYCIMSALHANTIQTNLLKIKR